MVNAGIASKLKRFYSRRFSALHWPLDSLTERVAATRSANIMNARAADKRFPIRGIRYWWLQCALLEELAKHDRETTIADLGCSRGHFRVFVGPVPATEWIGLDLELDQALLHDRGYSYLQQCDFDRPLPLADDSADIAVFSHVIEHLPRPDFTLQEISRILRPGGLLLAGSPVAPALVSELREWQLRSRLKRDKINPGGHINSMDGRRWKKLLREANLEPEKIAGIFLARWSGNPLENQAWWVRFNLLWGALFPAWGGEIYLSARKKAGIAAALGTVLVGLGVRSYNHTFISREKS